MMEVTRLIGASFFLNPDMIVSIDSTPDTMITLSNGEKLLVKEPPEVLIKRFIDYKREINREPRVSSQATMD